MNLDISQGTLGVVLMSRPTESVCQPFVLSAVKRDSRCSQSIVKGELEVKEGLPEHLAQGMFKTGGSKHPICMRYSTEPTDRVDDRIPQPRGLGMKVFEVDGPKLRADGKDPRTHDLVGCNDLWQ